MVNDARRATFEYTANQLIIIRRLAHGSRGWGLQQILELGTRYISRDKYSLKSVFAEHWS